jgi:8-oxo-dGTP pyrophosphatase MutT (NUDIX family)
MTVKPKDAATVILLRNPGGQAEDGFEVLMVLRSRSSKFVPGFYVFPGGAVDKDDCSPAMEGFCGSRGSLPAHQLLDDPPSPARALGAWVAGIRETFEEAGLFLAYGRHGALLSFDGNQTGPFHRYRELLRQGKMSFRNLLQKEGLTLATDRLHYFSHWITPWFYPIRYDVRFFVAEAPAGQEALHDGGELTEHVWIKPRDALDLHRANRFDMVFPTVMTMKALSKFGTIGEALQSTVDKRISAESG